MLRTRRPLRFPTPRRLLAQDLPRAVERNLGLVGNAAFLIGSLFFLSESLQTLGVWIFIVGSATVLIAQLRTGP